MTEERAKELQKLCLQFRNEIVDLLHDIQTGHPGGSLSCTEIVTTLYYEKMNIDPKNPNMEGRDHFILSKGHAAPILYIVLAELGFFPKEDLKTLRKPDSYLQGHPNMHDVPGVDMSTGSLGQGISAAVGMALGAKLSGKDWRVYTILGDGEIQEGQVWEAAMFAAAKKLDNLLAVVDNNNLQIDGTVEEVNSPYPIPEKFKAFGWNVIEIDGHDFDQIDSAFSAAELCKGCPTAVIAKTIKGKGVSYMENQVGWHGSAPNEEQYQQAMAELLAAEAAEGQGE